MSSELFWRKMAGFGGGGGFVGTEEQIKIKTGRRAERGRDKCITDADPADVNNCCGENVNVNVRGQWGWRSVSCYSQQGVVPKKSY